MYAVAVGDAFNGLTMHGPFVDASEAAEWAEDALEDGWTCVEMTCPFTTTLVIENVDLETLQEQYERLQEVVAFVEAVRIGTDHAPDASILDGVVEMLGDVLPIKGVPE